MLTRRWRSESLEIRRWVRQELNGNDRLSLRLRDARIGAAGLGSIFSAVLIVSVVTSFSEKQFAGGRALSIVLFLFAPAILSAIYSIFFEKSKVYGSVDLFLAGIVLLAQPFTWYWFDEYLPFVFVFAVFCAAVRLLARKGRQ
jgi:hypothetical protein